MKLQLTLAYDGRPFRGWQSQRGGGAVQDHIESAFATILGRRVAVTGAGRTDAGVHALAQTAHAEVPAGRPPVWWQSALNGNLPPEIRVMHVRRVPDRFHARLSATGKTYRYRLCTQPALPPHEIGRAWHMPIPLDPRLLNAAARTLEGFHDFCRFSANRGTPVADTRRCLRKVGFRTRRGILEIDFEGDGFLYKMVRILTGTLVRIASGRIPLAVLDDLLKGQGQTGPAAPPYGLWLIRVDYGPLRSRNESPPTDRPIPDHPPV